MSEANPQDGDNSIDLRELLEAGCHFGHQSRRWNPKMDQYIYTTRDGVHIFDLAITAEKLTEAMSVVEQWGAEGKVMVMVGTKRQAEAIVREEAVRVGAPYVTTRWLGGTLSNWEEMQKRIGRLNELKEKKEAGELKKYTKKEQVLFDREIARLERFFGGIAHLKVKPDALFIVDTHREDSAVAEAVLLDIPIVGLVDTNADPDDVTYVIPVNDDAVRSIKLMVTKIADAYLKGKSKVKDTKQQNLVQQPGINKPVPVTAKPSELKNVGMKVQNLEPEVGATPVVTAAKKPEVTEVVEAAETIPVSQKPVTKVAKKGVDAKGAAKKTVKKTVKKEAKKDVSKKKA
jgi:small subunit ribosomal protein S2